MMPRVALLLLLASLAFGQTNPWKRRDGIISPRQSGDSVSIGTTLLGACGGTDDTAMLQAALDGGGTVVLPTGTCVASNLVPTKDVAIRGHGKASILSMKTGATGWLIDGSTYGVRLSDLVLDGGLSSTQAANAGAAGTRSGVQLNATVLNSGLYNVVVRGFDNIGVGLNGASTLRVQTPALSNVNAYFNYIGIQTRLGASGTAGEYSRITGCSVTGNRYGLIINSGNMVVVGNVLSDNGYNVQIDRDANGGHGVLSGNAINHGTLYNLYATNTSLIDYGYVITSNQLWAGNIKLDNVSGFSLIANEFGNATTITLSGAYSSTGSTNILALNKFVSATTLNVASPGWLVYDNQASDGTYMLGAKTLKTAPQYTLGADLATNGAFDSDTGWTKGTGWTIAGGVAHSASGGATQYLTQNISATANTLYAVTYTISNYVSGSWQVGIGGSFNQWAAKHTEGNGTYTDYVFFDGTTGSKGFYFSGGATMDIDNLTVKVATAVNTNAVPTACTGAPSGSVYSNAGVLTLCP